MMPFSLITKLSHIVDNIEAVNKFEEGLERDYLMLSITNLCTFDELWAWIGENTSVTLKLDLHSFVTERLLKFNANKTPASGLGWELSEAYNPLDRATAGS